MTQNVTIWSPVIVSSLTSPRNDRYQRTYHMDLNYKRIEDIKVRIKSCQVKVQGKSVESRIELELLCLLEDFEGSSRLVNREEIFKEQISLRDFDGNLNPQLGLRFIVDILEVVWDGDIIQQNLNINYDLRYNLLASREQLVQIQIAPDEESQLANKGSPKPDQWEEEWQQANEENHKLRQQMYVYERDLLSLKRSIQKKERQSNSLNQELGSYKDMVAELKEALKRKDRLICSFEDEVRPASIDSPALPVNEARLGHRIKKMFLSNQ